MKDEAISEKVVLERWRLDNNLVSQEMQNNLFLYGSIIHKDVEAVDMAIVVERKEVQYKAFFPRKILKKINTFNKLRGTKSLWGMWRLARLLKAQGNLDLQYILNKFVKDLCGPKWSATLTIHPESEYRAETIVQSKDDQVQVG